jgi:membrane protein YqaA with SNARE-associated domain
MVIVWIFQPEINDFGSSLMKRYQQNWIDLVLFLLCAVSCSPLVLPVWGYVLVGIGLGYDIYRLIAVMSIGSATGSLITFTLGKYYSNRAWVKRKFPNILKHPWTFGKSRKYVTWILLVGAASPIPCDVLFAACGAKRYPAIPFFLVLMVSRVIRYSYLAIIFAYFINV